MGIHCLKDGRGLGDRRHKMHKGGPRKGVQDLCWQALDRTIALALPSVFYRVQHFRPKAFAATRLRCPGRWPGGVAETHPKSGNQAFDSFQP